MKAADNAIFDAKLELWCVMVDVDLATVPTIDAWPEVDDIETTAMDRLLGYVR